MNILTLTTGKDGVLPKQKPNTSYVLVEVTDTLKQDIQSPAKMATGHRHVVTLEDFTPFPEEKISAKPQGE